jgi:hypothetical protein
MPDYRRRQHNANAIGNTAGVTAGSVGAVLGSQKLRDAYREDNPAKFVRATRKTEVVLHNAGVSQQARSKILRVATHSKVGFKPLAVATVAGGIAAGAHQYEQHAAYKGREQRRQRRGDVVKSAFGVEHEVAKADRNDAAAVAGGAASAGLGASARKSLRAGRGHLVRAGEHESAAAASVHLANQEGQVVGQRLLRHTGEGPGSLPRTTQNVQRTLHAHVKQQSTIATGLKHTEASHAAATAGKTAIRHAKGKAGAAVAVGAVTSAAVASRRKKY